MYIIEHSTNGIVKTEKCQFTSASFNSPKEARKYIKEIVKYSKIHGYSFEKKSYFTVLEKVDSETTKQIGYKIHV